MKNIINSVYGAIIGLLVTYCYTELTSTYKWTNYSSLSTTIFVSIALIFIFEYLKGTKIFRRSLTKLSRAEGTWLVEVKDHADRPYSLCKIYISNGVWVFKGHGIDQDNKLASSWVSRDMSFNEVTEELSYTGDASVMITGDKIKNYGYISFTNCGIKKYCVGSGYFIDISETPKQVSMSLKRIDEKEYIERLNALTI